MLKYVRRIDLPEDCSTENFSKAFVECLVANGGQLQNGTGKVIRVYFSFLSSTTIRHEVVIVPFRSSNGGGLELRISYFLPTVLVLAPCFLMAMIVNFDIFISLFLFGLSFLFLSLRAYSNHLYVNKFLEESLRLQSDSMFHDRRSYKDLFYRYVLNWVFVLVILIIAYFIRERL